MVSIPKWIPHLRVVEDLPEEADSVLHDTETPIQTHDDKALDSDGSVVVDPQQVSIVEEAHNTHRPWWKFFDEYEYSLNPPREHLWSWYSKDDSPAERRLLQKLDILLCFYTFVAYWVKYLDQTNLNNAYVTGMKGDLGMKGNDLVITQAVYTVGSVVFQIPFMYLFVKVPVNFTLPAMDIGWGIFTLVIYKATNVGQLQAFRFFVGVFESSFYPACHFMYGCWYKPSEYGRRGAILYFGQMLGILTASLLQSATFRTLDGVNGLEGWRWMFIIDAIITFPIGLIGFFSLPGTPDKCYSLFLTDDEIRLARKRVRENGIQVHSAPRLFDLSLWKRILTDWRIYAISFWNILCWNNNNGTSGSYLLWLQSLHRYSKGKLNNLGAASPALGIAWIFLTCTGADLFRSRWGAIVVSQMFNITGNVILAVWDVPEGAKWFAFMLQYTGWAMASVLYGWLNDICKRDVQERAIVLLVANILAQSSTAWISVLVWKTVEAPRYLKGFSFTATSAFCLSLFTFVILYLYKKEEKKAWLKRKAAIASSKVE